MADSGGWVKLHRSMLGNPIFLSDGMFKLWSYCLLRASWEPRKWQVPGTSIVKDVGRGAFITGRESLHASLYPSIDSDGNAIRHESVPSPKTLWRRLELLRDLDRLTIENVSNRCSMVTVTAYDTYCTPDSEVVQPIAPDVGDCGNEVGQADGHSVSTIKERKKLRKKEIKNGNSLFPNESDSEPTKKFTPPTIAEVQEYCSSIGKLIDAEAFVAHHENRGWIPSGSRQVMRNWHLAVTQWAKNEIRFGIKQNGFHTNGSAVSRFKPIGTVRDKNAVREWMGLHPANVIPRDQYTFDKIFSLATAIKEQDEFYEAVAKLIGDPK